MRLAPAYRKRFGDFQPNQGAAVSVLLSCNYFTASKKRGLTQAQLAEALGKPQSFIAKVENGERRLDVVEFVHLARLVGVDLYKVMKDISK